MKGKRQEKILEIIRTNDIETQEELTKKLSEAGFSSTQGTISRDIRELKLTKVTVQMENRSMHLFRLRIFMFPASIKEYCLREFFTWIMQKIY